MADSGADHRALPSVVGSQAQSMVIIFGETGRKVVLHCRDRLFTKHQKATLDLSKI
jgi:hypothetical protein